MQTVLSLKNILSKLFVYLILLPIVGLYSKTCLKRPLKDILYTTKDVKTNGR